MIEAVLEICFFDMDDIFGNVELDRFRFRYQVQFVDIVGGSSHTTLSFDVIQYGVANEVELDDGELLVSLFYPVGSSRSLKESRFEGKS